MTRAFPHLHVASGYSMQYGTSMPSALVEAATGLGMDTLALTDRDGLYGAVKFALACQARGIAPVLGVDLAVEPDPVTAGPPAPRRRTPVRGGASVDPRRPRATVLALGADPAAGRWPAQGWKALCRLVTATHLRGERGLPVTTRELLAHHAALPDAPLTGAALAVMLGPDSEIGRAVLARRLDVARARLARWQAVMPPGSLVIEVVHHRGPQDGFGGLSQAGRMLALARDAGVPAVLTNAVRSVDPAGAMVADVLDASRRLVPLDFRHLDRVTSQGFLAPGADMELRAREVARAAGDEAEGARLLADTAALAARCRLDPGLDLGIGVIHLPEPHVLDLDSAAAADAELHSRCHKKILERYPDAGIGAEREIRDRLDAELRTIRNLGYAMYFLTVEQVCDLIRGLGARVAARGSGAGSLVAYLLGISGIDPVRHDLVVQRFLSSLRSELPDIDIDVEAARRPEIYEAIVARFGAERVACVSMMDTYRVRHAVRDAGAALGLPPAEIDAIAKAFPHIRARDARHAIEELPELRALGLGEQHLSLLFDLVEQLDGLPRHVALHPCGVLLADTSLLDRTPVEESWAGFPMSQFDKDDVEQLGLLKLDVLGIRMQSAMAFALAEVARVDGSDTAGAGGHDPSAGYLGPDGRIDLDAVPHDDEPTYRLIRTAHTLGCFQIESPGQRELIGKFGPETFADLIVDISLFRPGPVKSDMIVPFLEARQGWEDARYLHPDLRPVLEETHGVVVFHEQILRMLDVVTGVGLEQADEIRRAMGSRKRLEEIGRWFRRCARERTRYDERGVEVRRYDDATLERIWAVLEAFASFGFCKAHAASFALPTYHSAWLKTHHPAAFLAGVLTHDPGMYPKRLLLDEARSLGISVLPLDVDRSEDVYRVERFARPREDLPPPPHPDLPDGRGYGIRLSLSDVKGIDEGEVARIVQGRPYASLSDFWQRAGVSRPVVERLVVAGGFDALYALGGPEGLRGRDRVNRRDLLLQVAELDRWSRAAARSTSRSASGATGGADGARQLPLELTGGEETARSGLPEMDGTDRVRAELEVLGLDVSRHVVDLYLPMMEALGVTRSRDVLTRRNRSEILVAGVKVATQTPPVRSGRRVVFLTLDDASGPVDATFFEDVQGPYATTVFHSWLLLVRGVVRRTGHRGISLRATGAWELPTLRELWVKEGTEAVLALLEASDRPGDSSVGVDAMGRRRQLVHPSGYVQSPYADIKSAGTDPREAPRKLWHASPGSSGR